MMTWATTMAGEGGSMLQATVQTGSGIGWVARVLAVLLVTLGPGVTQAESDYAAVSTQLIREGTTHRPLFGIAFAEDGVRGIAVGDRGTVVLTRDGGKTWTTEGDDTALALLDVALAGERMIAVGQMGLVLIRVGDGAWERRPVGVDERLLSVDLHADGLAVAVGGFGEVRISTDNGSTWSVPDTAFSRFVEEGYDPHLYAVEITDSGRIIIAGEFGLVLVSDDRGANWRLVRQGDESLSALHVRADGVGYAVGQDGIILKTVDAGDHWERVDPGLGGNLLGVSATPEGLVTVPGMRNMLVSTDDGITFLRVGNEDVNSNWYQQAASGGAGTFVVGHTGRILRSTGR